MYQKRKFPCLSFMAALAILLSMLQPPVARAVPLVENQPKTQIDAREFRPLVVMSVKNDRLPALRDVAPRLRSQAAGREIPLLKMPFAEKTSGVSHRDRAFVQDEPLAPSAMPAPLQSFEGVTNLFGGWPPDTQGDIGPNHYIQWINLSFAIWQIDKVNNTASLVYGPAAGNTLFVGMGGACENTNDGDPITLFDPFANRWFMSQFALPNFPNGPFYQCVAVSVTSDPTGAWYRYAFQMPVDKMNDYPKFGVWPDAYYMTVNQFDAGSLNWAGAGVAAMDRIAMLSGAPATMIFFDLFNVNPDYGSILPADFDGLDAPPAGSPGYFTMWGDGVWMPPADALYLWEFDVDWANPSNSTFGVLGDPNAVIATADVDPNIYEIPQPSPGISLDAISDRLMHRLQYRNFNGYETLVSNHTVDVDGFDHAGVHWFELHKSGSAWSMYQEGVYAPDSDHRWMGSVALDHVGDLALGYSVSSASTYPSVRYSGRLSGDPLGVLPQGEQSMVEGSGSQTGHYRWGDYSMMGVDPVDDCTFWYTQEYVPVTGSNTWSTRIGSFRFPGCTIGPRGQLGGTVTNSATSIGISGAQIQATLSGTQTFTLFTDSSGDYLSDMPVGSYDLIASAFGYQPETVNDVEVFENTLTTQNFSLDPLPTYTVSGVVSDATTGWPLYAQISFPGTPLAPIWTNPETGTYSIVLYGGIAYTFDVEAFVPGYQPASIPVGPLSANTILNIPLDVDALTCNAPGYQPTYIFLDDFESGYGNWSMDGLWNPESESDVCGSWAAPFPSPSNASYYGIDGTCSYDTGSANSGSLTLTSAVSLPPSGGALSLWSYEETECGGNCSWDNRWVEISTNGGGTWQSLGELGSEFAWYQQIFDLSPYAGENALIRFRFDSVDLELNSFLGWLVDNVAISGGCQPMAGSLVVGNTFDENTSLPLNGALVSNDSGFTTTTQATPSDSAVPDGFYSLFSPAGSHVFTATLDLYGAGVQTVPVPALSTIRQDLYLPAGRLAADPTQIDQTMQTLVVTLPFTISNQGGAATPIRIYELDDDPHPLGPRQSPSFMVKPFKQGYATSEGLHVPELPPATPLFAGDVLQSWPVSHSAWGIAYDKEEGTVWVSDPAPTWGGDDLLHEYTTAGGATGRSYPHTMPHIYGPADMAYNWNTGMMWIMNVSSDQSANCIYEIDPASGYTGRRICPGGTGFATSQRGLAYDPSTDTYFAGSWNDLMIHHFDADGNILDEVDVGLPIAGLAYNPDSRNLFVMVNDVSNPVYVLDTANNYALRGMFYISQGFGANAGAGMEFDCDGHLWAVDQQTETVYQFDSSESTTLCEVGVPWLSESQTSLTLQAHTDQVIDLTFFSLAVGQPGVYHARLKIWHRTPYSVPATQVIMRKVLGYTFMPLVRR